MIVTSIVVCCAGSFGGGSVVLVQGSGFSPAVMSVRVCGVEAELHSDVTTTSLTFNTPSNRYITVKENNKKLKFFNK